MTMTTTLTPIARKWHQRLDSGILTRGQVRELTTGILARSFGDIGGHRSNMTEDEAQAIIDRVVAEKPRITQEQTDFGLHWLRTTGKRAGFDPSILDDFSPRIAANLGRCVWEHPGRGWNGYPWRCHRTAVERIPEAPDLPVGVCAEHARRWPQTVRWRYEASLRNAGLEVVSMVQPTKDHGIRFDPGVDDDLFDDLVERENS